ncbi:MAG: hypothetical protein ABEJ58_01220 [Halodesulfurarchaeum sp.]
MERKRALLWAGKYFLLTSGLSIVGLALVGAGTYFVYQFGVGNLYGLGIPAPTTGRSIGGLVAIVVGIAIWRGGKAWALYLTMTGALQEELGETFDTEHVKSDIVSVLDERLADMQQDVQSVNRELRSVTESSDFEFGDESAP